jgi:hypothetical protein
VHFPAYYFKYFSVADPNSGPSTFLISESGSGNQNKFFPDPNISESLVTIFEVKKLQFFGQLAQFFSVLFEK